VVSAGGLSQNVVRSSGRKRRIEVTGCPFCGHEEAPLRPKILPPSRRLDMARGGPTAQSFQPLQTALQPGTVAGRREGPPGLTRRADNTGIVEWVGVDKQRQRSRGP
jgi:hypothetical protein